MPTLDSPATVADVDFGFRPTTPQVGRTEPPALADLDIAMPPTAPARQPTANAAGDSGSRFEHPPVDQDADRAMPRPRRCRDRPSSARSSLPRRSIGALPDEQAQRLTANTDQATVPLIDFDLSAVSLNPTTKRGETEPGSALAQQMATKLDLARGYIDLGVKDGARELLDEVMRDGTREQRQAAVELIKQIEG